MYSAFEPALGTKTGLYKFGVIIIMIMIMIIIIIKNIKKFKKIIIFFK